MNLYRSVQTFVTVIEQQSFAQAGRKLYRSAPQITKDVNWLEDELGVTLLHRTSRKLSLTERGEQFYPFARQMLDEYKMMKAQLQLENEHVSGKLVVSMPTSFAHHSILDKLPGFLQSYPQIKLDCQLTNRYTDLIAEKINLAIRVDHPNKEAYWHQPFMIAERGVFASPAYLKKHGAPKHPHDLTQRPCLLHNEMANPYEWRFKNDIRVPVNGRYSCNSTPSLVHMAQKDFGFVYLVKHQIQNSLNNGTLVEILADYVPEPKQMIFCAPKQDFLPKKVQAFIDYFTALIKSGCVSTSFVEI